MTRSVTTVTGPVGASRLGFTSAHEHVLIDLRPLARDPQSDDRLRTLAETKVGLQTLADLTREPFFYSRDNLLLDDLDVATAELTAFRQSGGRTVVDLTSHGLGPQPEALRRISALSGVNIIAGCGHYVALVHTTKAKSGDMGAIRDEIERDLTQGISGTSVRAGVIGELGTGTSVEPAEERVLKAAAQAQQTTGAPIFVHTHLWQPQGERALDILEQAGANPRSVAISHVDHGQIDLQYQIRILRRGAFVVYDGFGKEWYVDSEGKWLPRDIDRINAIRQLVDQGFGGQILAGNDICTKMQLRAFGGWSYEHLPRNIVPLMLRMDLSIPVVDAIFGTNAQFFLTAARRP